MTAANLILENARVRTLDEARPSAEAVAIADGMIVAVGDRHDVAGWRGAGTEVIDLQGAALLPGLVDSHQHPFLGTQEARGVDLTGVRTLEGVLAALRRERLRCNDGEWVHGFALAYEVFGERAISSQAIDDAVGGAPALLHFFDFHTALASTAAISAAKIDGPRRFAEEAEIVCVDGRPTGELRENGAISLVTDVVPHPTQEALLASYRDTFRRMNAAGLTGAHVMRGSPALLDTCRELEGRGWLTMRLVMPMHLEPDVADEEVDRRLAAVADHGRRWRAGSAKFFIDGVVETGTAWLVDPDTQGRGLHPFWPEPDRYAELVARFARAGFQCTTHAVGDQAVRAALDAYRAAGAAPGTRHRVEHIETLQDQDLPRFAAERVIASMQPIHLEGMHGDRSDPWSRALGPSRCDRAFRTRDLLDSGAVVALGSDWPVARFDPRRGMAWARQRRAPGEREALPYGSDQAMTALEALAGYTTAAAFTVGEHQLNGRIAPGFRADLTAMATDPVDTPADDLVDVPIVLTLVDGEVVYRSHG
jgi:predicted amidohydrolase YtcJ